MTKIKKNTINQLISKVTTEDLEKLACLKDGMPGRAKMLGQRLRQSIFSSLAIALLLTSSCGVHSESLKGDGTPGFRGAGLGSGDPRYVASASATARIGQAYAGYIDAQAEAVREGRYPAGYSPGFLPPYAPGLGTRTLCVANESAWDVRVELESWTPGVEYPSHQFYLPTGAYTTLGMPSGRFAISAYAASTGQGVRPGSFVEVPDSAQQTYRGRTFNAVWVAR